MSIAPADLIKSKCEELERSLGIRILFAVENGSRAWNLESTDSDYDVRFVFCRPKDAYLRLSPPEDVISIALDRHGAPTEQEGCFIDMVGFDIFKFAKLLLNSNPTVVEWIVSPICYYGKAPARLTQYVHSTHLNLLAFYHHYRSMCRENYSKYIHTTVRKTTHKNYMYSLRGLMCARYVEEQHKVPPSDFLLVMDAMTKVPESVLTKLHAVIEVKKQMLESEGEKIPLFDEYIESFLKSDALPSFPEVDKRSQQEELNRFLAEELNRS